MAEHGDRRTRRSSTIPFVDYSAPDLYGKRSSISSITVNTPVFDNKETSPRPPVKSRFSLDEFINRLTCHGVQDWYCSKNKFETLFWGFLFVVAFGILLYSIVLTIKEFYVNPITTAISIEPLRGVPFPDITVCPESFISHSAINKDYASKKDILKRLGFFRKIQGNDQDLGQEITHMFQTASDMIPLVIGSHVRHEAKPAPSTLAEHQEEIFNQSFAPDRFIRECSFQGRHCSSYSTVERHLDIDWGVCYMISVNRSMQLRRNRGMKIVIDLQIEDQTTEIDFIPVADGVTLRIDEVYTPTSWDGVLLVPGQHYKVKLTAKKHRLISVPQFSQTPQACVSIGRNGSVSKSQVPFAVLDNDRVPYSLPVCSLDCTQEVLMDTVGCILPVDVRYIRRKLWKLTEFCKNISVLETLDKNDTSILACQMKCLRACDETLYQLLHSSHSIPSQTLFHHYLDGLDMVSDMNKPLNGGPWTNFGISTASSNTGSGNYYLETEEYSYEDFLNGQREVPPEILRPPPPPPGSSGNLGEGDSSSLSLGEPEFNNLPTDTEHGKDNADNTNNIAQENYLTESSRIASSSMSVAVTTLSQANRSDIPSQDLNIPVFLDKLFLPELPAKPIDEPLTTSNNNGSNGISKRTTDMAFNSSTNHSQVLRNKTDHIAAKRSIGDKAFNTPTQAQPRAMKKSQAPIMKPPNYERQRNRNLGVYRNPRPKRQDGTRQSRYEKAEYMAREIQRMASSIIVIDISFPLLEVTSVIQSPSMTPNTLLANLGGVLGLWLGASLFTVTQAIVFCCEFVAVRCSRLVGKQ